MRKGEHRGMIVVERDRELAVFRQARESAWRGEGTVLLVTGPSGCGKSVLLSALAQETGGATLLRAAAASAERTHRWGVVHQLLDEFVPTGPEEPDARVPVLLSQLPETGPEQPGIVRSLAAALLNRGSAAPLVLLVDNAHLADEASLGFLMHLGRRLYRSPVVLVLAETSTVDVADRLGELVAQPHCRQLVLSGLTRPGIGEVVVAWHGGRPQDLPAERWMEVTGGNPVLVQAAASDGATGEPGAHAAPAVGVRFREAVRRCLARSGPDALVFAAALALLGDGGDATQLIDQFAILSQTSGGMLRLLEDMGFATSGGSLRESVRSVVLDLLTARQRQRLSATIAEKLHARGASSTDVAEHLLAAGTSAPGWGIDVLSAAAERAVLTGDLAPASAYLDLALRSSPDGDRRVALALRLAQLAWAGQPHRLGHATDRLAAALRTACPEPALAPAALSMMLWHRAPEDLRPLLGIARENPVNRPETALLERHLATTHPPLAAPAPPASSLPPGAGVIGAAGRAGGGQGGGGTVGERALRLALQAETQLATALGTGVVDRAAAVEVLQRVQLGDPRDSCLATALLALLYAGDLDTAETWSLRVPGAGASVPSAGASLFDAASAEMHWRLGNLESATRSATLALERIPWAAWGVAVGAPAATLIHASTARGHLAEAAVLLERPVPPAMFDSRYGVEYLFARAHFRFATREYATALTDLRECGHLLRAWGMDRPEFLPWRSWAAMALAGLGEPCRARELAEEEIGRLAPSAGRSFGTALRALAVTGDPVERPRLLRESADILLAHGARYELALTWAELGRCYAEGGERERAGAAYRRARTLVGRAHRPGGEADPPATAGPGPEGPVELSDAERRVAHLAARGRTNREISEQLFVTVSTVEQHLTRVYRKLGVRRRRQLAERLPTDEMLG